MKGNHALHLYFGEGKGKTTASMGLAVRAAGQGKKVLLSQFMKTNNSGELNSLALLPNIKVVFGAPIEKLTTMMTPEELAEEHRRQRENFDLICREIDAMCPDVIVLDEMLVAESMGFLKAEEILSKVDGWLENSEVILTGRWACDALKARADYITEMKKHKHPFDNGVMARKGIEF